MQKEGCVFGERWVSPAGPSVKMLKMAAEGGNRQSNVAAVRCGSSQNG